MKALRKVSNRKFNKAKLRKMAPRGAEYQTAEINTNIYSGKVFRLIYSTFLNQLHSKRTSLHMRFFTYYTRDKSTIFTNTYLL